MELILISDSKLKIMLTTDDMKAYALDCSTLDYDNTETRKAFWSILDEAKHRTGFDAASEKVFVQVYPSKAGGCEMYVTKLGLFADRSVEEDFPEENIRIRGKNGKERRGEDNIFRYGCAEREKSAYISRSESAYRFETIEQLIGACRRLLSLFRGKSEAYSDGQNYYLYLKEKNSQGQTADLHRVCRIFLSEYAECIDVSALMLYVGEYGKQICADDAVGTLGKL